MNQTRKCLGIFAAGIVIAACGGGNNTRQTQQDSVTTTSQSLLPDGHLLVPGKSAGTFLLDDADSAVFQQLGKPDFGDAAMGKAVSIWYTDAEPNYPFSIFTSRDMGNDETARIKQIRVTSPRFKTVQSIGVGSSLRDISDAYPLQIVETYDQNGQTYTVYNVNEGIAFEVDTAYRCVAVVIHQADATIPTYLPLQPPPSSQPR